MAIERNPFKPPMNALQRQWYRVLLARKVGFGSPTPKTETSEESYQTICRKRYSAAFRRYNKHYSKEIEQLILMQPSALDSMRLHRCFAITTLWPPLHSKREINLTLEQLEKVLSVKERRRLEEILKQDTRKKYF